MPVSNLSNFINGKVEKLIHTHSESDVINQIRSFLFKNYIKTVVEQVDSTADGFRMMFIANRFKSKFDNPITKECNGSVFYYSRSDNRFYPLVIPTHMFNSQKLVKSNIHNIYKNGGYDVYPVLDGTVVNLYNYKGEWRISTNKAYDATNLVMYDDKTYMDVFNESLSYNNNIAVKTYLESLDKNTGFHSISMCVKNSGFHIFQENFTTFGEHLNNRITIIHHYFSNIVNNLYKSEKVVMDSNSVVYSFTSESMKKNSNGFMSWKELNNNITSSIQSFKKYNNQIGFVPFLGVILRSKSENGEYNNILMESNLMSKVRNFIYNFGFSKNLTYKNILSNNYSTGGEEMVKSYYNMSCLNRLYIFLNRKDVSLFLSLFPHFKKEFAEFNQFFSFLTTFIMKNSSTLEKNLINVDNILSGSVNISLNKLPEHQDNDTMNHIYKPSLSKLCMVIIAELALKQININSNHEGWCMLNDFIINSKFLDYYYAFMYKC